MKKTIHINENGLYLVMEITEAKEVRFLHFSSMPYDEHIIKEIDKKKFRLVELHMSGENQDDHHGSKHTGTMPGNRLVYKEDRDYMNEYGRKIEIVQEDQGILVTSNFQFYKGISVVRSWTDVENRSELSRGIEYVSSFCLTGLSKEGLQSWDTKSRLFIPHNAWMGELQWREYTLPELGLSKVYSFSTKPLAYNSSGTWSSSKYLPMGMMKNVECANMLYWQIEHNGSWHWEIGDCSEGFEPDAIDGYLYLHLSGPTENENHWWKELKKGEVFSTVPVAIGSVGGGVEEAIGQLTKYRRTIRRVNKDNEKLPVIFNDYMNCLFGDPTTEKLLPLIDSAAEVGCEYFCIDAGWYSDGEWWDGVGEWLPSKIRFPNGIEEPLNYIWKKGMIPGLWLEIEVMGINCPMVKKVSEDWFFKRHGKPVIDRGRYQLDFRNKEVIEHANSVIDRLVNEYKIGYIKMDYNINAGVGTENNSDSFGDGLLQHNRAYLNWLDNVFERYPDLVIENCSSGGMRMDYGLLSRHSIQSTSDQCDYKVFSAIAAASPSAITPEQAAVWTYPMKDAGREEIIFNMVNAMLLRIHQSGHLAEISIEGKTLIKEGIDYYKTIRDDIKKGLPVWPLGLPTFYDEWIALGLYSNNKVYLSVWRLNGSNDTCILPIKMLSDLDIKVKCSYPKQSDVGCQWNKQQGTLSVRLPMQNTARIFELS